VGGAPNTRTAATGSLAIGSSHGLPLVLSYHRSSSMAIWGTGMATTIESNWR